MTPTHRHFGVEQENFILHDDGTPPSHDEMDSLYGQLLVSGFRPGASHSNGWLLAVERLTEFGTLVVTNDAFTHVLEVAFPPLNNLEEFRRLYVESYSLIHDTLRMLGLRVWPGGAIAPPRLLIRRPKAADPDGTRLDAILNREAIAHPLYHSALPACIASTQVSLHIPDVEAIRLLERFYEFESLVPVLFGNSPEFNGVKGWCVRPLAWHENFSASDPLVGIPRRIPMSLAEYERMRQSHRFRDFSFVSIRSADRVEFRSACSQNSIDDNLWLVRFRLAVDLACARGDSPRLKGNVREQFTTACWDGPGAWCATLFQSLVEIDPELAHIAGRLTQGAAQPKQPDQEQK